MEEASIKCVVSVVVVGGESLSFKDVEKSSTIGSLKERVIDQLIQNNKLPIFCLPEKVIAIYKGSQLRNELFLSDIPESSGVVNISVVVPKPSDISFTTSDYNTDRRLFFTDLRSSLYHSFNTKQNFDSFCSFIDRAVDTEIDKLPKTQLNELLKKLKNSTC